jgi:phosphate transport system substrate-binding protein
MDKWMVAVVALVACRPPERPANEVRTAAVRVDGSSTVYPISKNVAERYKLTSKNLVEVAVSGTGGGLRKLCRGELDVAGASRPISSKEMADCASAGVEFVATVQSCC